MEEDKILSTVAAMTRQSVWGCLSSGGGRKEATKSRQFNKVFPPFSSVSSILTVVVVVVSTLLIAQVADGAVCYRKYHELKQACKGVVKATGDADSCCSKHGQGHSIEVKRLGHSKNWYECVPCGVNPDDVLSVKDNRIAVVKPRPPPEVAGDQRSDMMQSIKAAIIGKTAEKESKERVQVHPSGSEEEPERVPRVDRQETDVWSPWSDWGPCSKSCDGGTHQRMRFCLKEKCSGEDFQEKPCPHLKPCIVDGGWGDWKSWSACSVTCGNGTKSRGRKCNNPAPLNGGRNCEGSAAETQSCSPKPCPVDGRFSSWSPWTQCNVTCGRGFMRRHRSCDDPPPSAGGQDCSGAIDEMQMCSIPCPVDGRWSDWSNWTTCSASCGEGYQTRSRRCDSPAPQHGGKQCVGLQLESMPCALTPHCVVDGNWTEWSRVDTCSARPCSGEVGYKTRFRSCTNPRPAFGGRSCQGRTWLREKCYNNDFCTDKVDGGWCEWTNLTECVFGLTKRERTCECPPPVNGGSRCQGKSEEEKACGGILDEHSAKVETVISVSKGACPGNEGSGDGSDGTCDDDEPEGVTPGGEDDDNDDAVTGSGDG